MITVGGQAYDTTRNQAGITSYGKILQILSDPRPGYRTEVLVEEPATGSHRRIWISDPDDVLRSYEQTLLDRIEEALRSAKFNQQRLQKHRSLYGTRIPGTPAERKP